jgi:hypothetical protein
MLCSDLNLRSYDVIPSLEDIYRSQNGDTWRLIRDAKSGRVFVRHEANPSSGGHITETDVEEFLRRGGSGPEYASLRNLLGKATEDGGDASSQPPQ